MPVERQNITTFFLKSKGNNGIARISVGTTSFCQQATRAFYGVTDLPIRQRKPNCKLKLNGWSWRKVGSVLPSLT